MSTTQPVATSPDLILLNATVRTMDDAGSVHQAVAIGDGRIRALGDGATVRALAGAATEVLDMDGACILPGLIDSHNHLLQTGLNAEHVDLSGAATVADVLSAIRARAADTPLGDWIQTSSRWHETQLREQRFPTRAELDVAAPGHPVLVRRGGHNVVANSRALALGGVDETTPDPAGGTYVRRDGRLTGHIIGAPAYARVAGKAPLPAVDQQVRAIAMASQRFAAAGLTGVIEPGLSADQIAMFRRAETAGTLSVRATLMERIVPGVDSEGLERARVTWAALEQVRGRPADPAVPPGDSRLLTVRGVKIVADGGVETNYLREPYAFTDDPSAPRGKPQVSPENLTEVCRWAARDRVQLGVHCVGDAAIDLVLDAFEAANREHPIAPLRWTLIHMILARPEHFDRARALGVIITAQQPLVYALGAGWVRYWGKERAERAMPMRAFAESGLIVGGGSDSPVTPYQPLLGIWSSVTRATELAGVLGPQWGCTVERALRMYTRGSAHCAFAEQERGRLAPGYLADLTVLAADPLRVGIDELRDLPVRGTMVGGRWTYLS